MARDLKLNVDGDSGGGQRALDEVAAASAAAAHEADRMAAQFRQASRDAAALDRQLAKTAVETRALARELSKNPADASIKAQLDGQKKAAAELRSIRRDVVGDTEKASRDASRFAESAARDLARVRKQADDNRSVLSDLKGIGGNLGEVGSGFGSALGPVGLGIAGAAAIPAIPAVGGALGVGAGLGAIGLGAAGAILGDPEKFGAAWALQTSHLKQSLIDASKPFQGPLLDAIKSVGPLVDSWHIDTTLAKASTFVKPLVSGISGFSTEIVAGVDALVQHGGPVFDELAQVLPEFGFDISQGLQSIAENAQGGAEALGDMVQFAGAVAEGLLVAVGESEKLYLGLKTASNELAELIRQNQSKARILTDGWSDVALALSDAMNSDKVAHFGHALSGVALSGSIAAEQARADAAAYEKLQQQLGVTAVKADTLAQGMSQIFQALLSADHAVLSWDESLTSLSESFKANGHSIDEHTAKGQANREAVLAAIAANAQLYVSNIESGKGVDFATSAYDKNEKQLEATLRQQGLNQQSIDGLVGKYRNVPDSVKTQIKLEGLTAAINDLDDVLRKANSLPPRKTINVNIAVAVTGATGAAASLLASGAIGGSPKHPKFNAKGAIRHAATGLIVGPSDPGTIIGEPQTGGEALIPLQGITQARAASLAQTAVRGYGLDVVPRTRVPSRLFGGGGSGGALKVVVEIGGAVDTAMGTAFMRLLRTGDVQIKASQLV